MKTNFNPVKDINLKSNMKTSEIISELSNSGGFMAKNLATGVEILVEMVNNKKCLKFLSFPAAPISTGLRGVFKEIIKRKLVDVIITTCGTLDHDIARCSNNYYEGDFNFDDDAVYKKGYHRLGNILIPIDSYGPLLENKIQPFLSKIYDKGIKSMSTYEFTNSIGEHLNNSSSILYWAHKNHIPIIIPGITDGAVGNQIWLFSQKHPDFKIDILKDEQLLSDLIFKAKNTGALMLGGGISKHHTLWWNQFRGGLDYAVYITTALEYDGSLSGAPVKEAVSWGKVKSKAKMVTINGEFTSLLPFMVSSLIDQIKR